MYEGTLFFIHSVNLGASSWTILTKVLANRGWGGGGPDTPPLASKLHSRDRDPILRVSGGSFLQMFIRMMSVMVYKMSPFLYWTIPYFHGFLPSTLILPHLNYLLSRHGCHRLSWFIKNYSERQPERAELNPWRFWVCFHLATAQSSNHGTEVIADLTSVCISLLIHLSSWSWILSFPDFTG